MVTSLGIISTGETRKMVSATPTLTVHAGYVAGDYVGTSGVAIDFANIAREPSGTGVIESAFLVDAVKASVACELWLFSIAVTPPADSAAFSVSDGDCARFIGVI